MVNKLQQLTGADKNEVLSGTSKVLPLRPSDNGWTAEQIREKGYQGIERLFDKVKTSLDIVIDDLNAKADQAEVAEDIAYLSNNLSILDSKIDDKDAELKAKIKQIEDIIRDISIEGDFATKEDLQNVIEIAEGKTKSYLLSCNDIIQEEFLPYMTYYNARGEVLTSEQVMSIVNNGTCVNNLFNSQDNQVPVWDVSNWYLIIEYNYPVMQNNSKVIITNMDNPFKQGDILIVTETDVPDRYATDIGIFYKMETSKVDLSTVVHKSGDETISGVKTFANGFALPAGATINTVGQVSKITVWGGSVVFDKNLVAGGNNTYDLGNTSNKWKDLFLSHQANIGNWWIRSLYDNLYFGFSENNNKIQLSATELKCDVDITAWANQNLGTNSNPFNDVNISGEIKVKDSVAQYKKVQCLTQDEYDALSTKDENVLYLIKE